MKRAGVCIASCGRDLTPILKSLACGLCMNVAALETSGDTQLGSDRACYKLARATGTIDSSTYLFMTSHFHLEHCIQPLEMQQCP